MPTTAHQFQMARRGTVYVLVLGISMMVMTLALGSMAVIRTQMQYGRDDADAADARAYAQSAIEIGRQLIAADPNWRTTRSNGTWIADRPIGSGVFSLSVVNPNGSLNNSRSDPVVMTGTGVKNYARHVTRVMLTPIAQPHTCLNATIAAAQHISISSTSVQHVGVLSANGNVSANSSLVVGNVEAAGSISGGSFAGVRTPGVDPKVVPFPDAFDHYIANGTAISINIVPKIGGIATIERRLFSPSNNPFGSTPNPQGIYYVDCGGAQIIVQNLRILGTLVLLNVGPNSVLQGACVAAPAVANYPTLLVRGDFRFAVSGNLSETGTPNVNFNPPGAPLNGASNTTATDSFASNLEGLFYASGSLVLAGNPISTGVVVAGGSISISSPLTMSYDERFRNDPPPGFSAPTLMAPLAGTWAQVVN